MIILPTVTLVVQWLASQKMDTATSVQILEETGPFSRSTNTLGKSMNSNLIPPFMGK